MSKIEETQKKKNKIYLKIKTLKILKISDKAGNIQNKRNKNREPIK